MCLAQALDQKQPLWLYVKKPVPVVCTVAEAVPIVLAGWSHGMLQFTSDSSVQMSGFVIHLKAMETVTTDHQPSPQNPTEPPMTHTYKPMEVAVAVAAADKEHLVPGDIVTVYMRPESATQVG